MRARAGQGGRVLTDPWHAQNRWGQTHRDPGEEKAHQSVCFARALWASERFLWLESGVSGEYVMSSSKH